MSPHHGENGSEQGGGRGKVGAKKHLVRIVAGAATAGVVAATLLCAIGDGAKRAHAAEGFTAYAASDGLDFSPVSTSVIHASGITRDS